MATREAAGIPAIPIEVISARMTTVNCVTERQMQPVGLGR